MANTTVMQIRIDTGLRANADALFAELGLDTPTAIRMFLSEAVKRDGIPFEVTRRYNAETIEALREAERITYDPNARTYANFAEILAEVKAEMADGKL